jgi:hypothetical protein
MRDSFRPLLGLMLLMAVAGQPAVAAPAKPTPATTRQFDESDDTHFLRFIGDVTKGGTLETSDVVYRNRAGVKVRLVSAVHIAMESYFQDIQRTVVGCDAVLYEMVKPKDSPPPRKGAQSDSGVSKLQRFLKDRLDLSFQLDQIDYSKKNFVHADLDAETFAEMQQERGESFATLMLSALLRSLSDPSALRTYDDEPTDMMDLMTRPDGERQIKLLLARHLGDIEREAMGINLLNGTVILTERNKAAMKALDKAITSGRRNIAIFYGAAHMPDLSTRLEARGFTYDSTSWRAAWEVQIRPDAPSAFQSLMRRAGQQLPAATTTK